MPAPLAHSCCGLLFYRDVRTHLFQNPVYAGSYCLFFSNSPDYDYLIGLVKGNLLWGHRLFTHTVLFALLAGVIAGVVGRMLHKKFFPVLAITSSLVLVHLLLDYLSFDCEPSNGIGVPLFWPLSDKFYNFPFHPLAHYLLGNPYSTPIYLIANEFYYVALSLGLIILMTQYRKRKGEVCAHRSFERYSRRA
jgi:inner membrane protein